MANNSFRIERSGPRAEVMAAIHAAAAQPKGSEPVQADAAKAAVLAMVKSLPASFTGIHVLAWGDWSDTGGEARLLVSGYVLPMKAKGHK